MTYVKITYHCAVCRAGYSSHEAAQSCESRGVLMDRGVKVGDIILVTCGEGAGHRARVTDLRVYTADWGPKRYAHTRGLTAELIDSWGSRQLTFDQYEVVT